MYTEAEGRMQNREPCDVEEASVTFLINPHKKKKKNGVNIQDGLR